METLLGEGGFDLPALGGLVLSLTDVTADPGGRFLRVWLAE
jgi:hypothetical protein